MWLENGRLLLASWTIGITTVLLVILAIARKKATDNGANVLLCTLSLGAWIQAVAVAIGTLLVDDTVVVQFVLSQLVEPSGIIVQWVALGWIAIRSERLCCSSTAAATASSATQDPPVSPHALPMALLSRGPVEPKRVWIWRVLLTSACLHVWLLLTIFVLLVVQACLLPLALLCLATLGICYRRIVYQTKAVFAATKSKRAEMTIRHVVRKAILYTICASLYPLLVSILLLLVVDTRFVALATLGALQPLVYAWSNESVQMAVYSCCPCCRAKMPHLTLVHLRGKPTVVRISAAAVPEPTTPPRPPGLVPIIAIAPAPPTAAWLTPPPSPSLMRLTTSNTTTSITNSASPPKGRLAMMASPTTPPPPPSSSKPTSPLRVLADARPPSHSPVALRIQVFPPPVSFAIPAPPAVLAPPVVVLDG